MQKPISNILHCLQIILGREILVEKAKVLGQVQSGRAYLKCRNEVLGMLRLLGG